MSLVTIITRQYDISLIQVKVSNHPQPAGRDKEAQTDRREGEGEVTSQKYEEVMKSSLPFHCHRIIRR